ncbi:MAG: carbamate kinase [Clostridium sp.]|nr:carbamate kinase [Clostridium sp.]
MQQTIVVALGGNAILRPGQLGTAKNQFLNIETTCKNIVCMIKQGYRIVITHGNGPQVGNILIQNQYSQPVVPAMPLDVCGAESQGLIGYMIQQSLYNELLKQNMDTMIITILTQIIVNENDPAFKNPTKPIGPFYTKEYAMRSAKENNEIWKEDAGRGWRKVVPSPSPVEIVEKKAINSLIQNGAIVIAAGGGGIPVIKNNRALHGIEAVIDKDLASSKLAKDIKADILMMLTDVEGALINYRTPLETCLSHITVDKAKEYLNQGQFKAGSMEPKVKAAIDFASSGKTSIIASLSHSLDALKGKSGTRIANNF